MDPYLCAVFFHQIAFASGVLTSSIEFPIIRAPQAANDRKGEAKTSKLLAQIRLKKVRNLSYLGWGDLDLDGVPERFWDGGTLPETNKKPPARLSHPKSLPTMHFQVLLLMEEILHHLRSIKLSPYQLVQDFFHQQYVSFRAGNFTHSKGFRLVSFFGSSFFSRFFPDWKTHNSPQARAVKTNWWNEIWGETLNNFNGVWWIW